MCVEVQAYGIDLKVPSNGREGWERNACKGIEGLAND